MKVWCVWSESGEYEQFSRDLHGIFIRRELAEAHLEQFRAGGGYDEVEVVADEVLDAIPTAVPYIEYAAHITPDGHEGE